MQIERKLPNDVAVFLQGLVTDVNSAWFEPGNEFTWRDGIQANAEAAQDLLIKYGFKVLP